MFLDIAKCDKNVFLFSNSDFFAKILASMPCLSMPLFSTVLLITHPQWWDPVSPTVLVVSKMPWGRDPSRYRWREEENMLA